MIHPQLLQDCHHLGRFEQCELLLNRNAGLPWFILVPDTATEDVLDLSPVELQRVTGECQRVSRFIKQHLGIAKVNFAGLGNVVPQMHLHVIGRSPDDPCWPAPVWGNLPETSAYDGATVASWREVLAAEYGLCAKG
jgi:diadenosine tetraphosphate (Ap4A) HIT family hydrolase